MAVQALPARTFGHVAQETAWGAAASPGAAPTISRSDHNHGTLAGLGTPVGGGLPGATAASRYVGATSGGAPASGTFSTGDWAIDNTYGVIWQCASGGSPGTWRTLGVGKLFGRASHSTNATIAANNYAQLAFTTDFDPGGMVKNNGLTTWAINPPLGFDGYYRVTIDLLLNPNPGTTRTDIRSYLAGDSTASPDTLGYNFGYVAGQTGPSFLHWRFHDTLFLQHNVGLWTVEVLNNSAGGSITTLADGRFSHIQWEWVGNGN